MTYGDNLGSSLLKTIEHDPVFRSVAYFSMEIGMRPEIPTYSGGLGILAGDILKGGADLGVPMAGITLLYRKGYFRQETDAEGSQVEKPVDWNPAEYLTPLPNEVSVQIEGRPVRIRAWVYDYVGVSGYPVPIYFLDTDFEGNAPSIGASPGTSTGGTCATGSARSSSWASGACGCSGIWATATSRPSTSTRDTRASSPWSCSGSRATSPTTRSGTR
jgi:hypothetical protein